MENQTENTPVAGERISSAGAKIDKPSFQPLETGDYEFKVVNAAIQPPSEDNQESVAYVKLRLDTEVNGKKRVLFHSFFLKTAPGKNGKISYNQGNGLFGFAKALGDDCDVTTTAVTAASGTEYIVLDPTEVKDWLNGKQGMTVKAHVKRKPADEFSKAKGYTEDKNEVSYFITN
jgi:hypothetical protein